MKVSAMMRWVGPAAIAGGVFLVFSDLSGLPITIPYLSSASPSGFDAVGSGVILIALTLLLVGMAGAGLYTRRPAPNAARIIEYGEAYGRMFPGLPSSKKSGARLRRDVPRHRLPGRAGPARWSLVLGSPCSS